MTAGELLAACALDAAIGDPRWWPHPVRWMGWAIAQYDCRIRRIVRSPTGERVAGLLLALGLPLLVYGVASALLAAAATSYAWAGTAATALFAFWTVSARDLHDHALAVRQATGRESLDEARRAVSHIVGRETAGLNEEEVVRAAVETVAESTADGYVAPLFYLVLGGPPLALAYKAVNTLDSMVGHRNEQYRHLGWASARLDDVANWIPARVTALLVILAGGLVVRRGCTVLRAWRILTRDATRHPSPNSGFPEAAMAGVLGVRLGGTNRYGGQVEVRPFLGEPDRPLDPGIIAEAVRVMWAAVVMAVALGSLALWWRG